MSLVVIAGGGTGGHLMPAIAIADALRRLRPGLAVQFVGAQRGLEAKLLPARGERVELLPALPWMGASWAMRLRALGWALPWAVARLVRAWRISRPRFVLGVGGYASVAAIVAAWLLRIPCAVYEQNARAGRANRRLAGLVAQVFVGFEEAAQGFPKDKVVFVGHPVRQEIRAVRWQTHTPPVLLVMGGSQGARWLNETLPEACAQIARRGRRFCVRHICGRHGDPEAIAARYRQAGIAAEVLPFCEEMAGFYAAGDLLVARAGAMTVAEAACVGMPAVFVPLPHAADDHQQANAEVLARAGAAVIARQQQHDATSLAALIEGLLFDPARLEAMSEQALAQSAPKADAQIAQAVLAAIEGEEA